MATLKLTEQELTSATIELDGWRVVAGKLHKAFKFSDFVAAFGFMTKVAIIAEKNGSPP